MPSDELFKLEAQILLSIDIAMKILPLKAEESDVQAMTIYLADLPMQKLESINEILDKYQVQEKIKAGKNLNRFQILKQE
jgi:hypothetical protein